jgi:hypothetical protein
MSSGIWHCVVWWTVASSAEEPAVSVFRMKAAQHHVPENSPCNENLKPPSLLYISHTIFQLLWTSVFNRSIKFPAPSKSLWRYFRVWSHSLTKIPRTEWYVTRYQITQSHKCCVRCVVRNKWMAKSQQWTCEHVRGRGEWHIIPCQFKHWIYFNIYQPRITVPLHVCRLVSCFFSKNVIIPPELKSGCHGSGGFNSCNSGW